jgi:hypothetical protein
MMRLFPVTDLYLDIELEGVVEDTSSTKRLYFSVSPYVQWGTGLQNRRNPSLGRRWLKMGMENNQIRVVVMINNL